MIKSDYHSLLFSTPPGSKPQGTVLLFHGLTASPDEVRGLAELLHENGYSVVVPCLAGHGTSVSDLSKVRAADWFRETDAAFSALEGDAPVMVGGVSFGALLALRLAGANQHKIRALFLLAPPFQFRKKSVELICRACFWLPELVLDRFGFKDKAVRNTSSFARPRRAYGRHSLGAIVRLHNVRRAAAALLPKIELPVLLMQDPADHHLADHSLEWVHSRLQQADVTVLPIAGGEHELTVGPRADRVAEAVVGFMKAVDVQEDECQEK